MPTKIICTRPYGCEAAGRCLSSDPDSDCGVDLTDADEAPSPVEVSASDIERARKDATTFGIGFTVDGWHVPPSRVSVFRGAHYPHVTTSELWNSLEAVLREKGASDAWLEYVMGDLQVAATQYGASCWAEGHKVGAAGEPMPNSQVEDAPARLGEFEKRGEETQDPRDLPPDVIDILDGVDAFECEGSSPHPEEIEYDRDGPR